MADLDYMARDRWLAHYTSADTAFRWILPDRRLLLNPYERMRDPLENRDLTFVGGGAFELPDATFERNIHLADAGIRAARKNFRLASFTQDASNDDRHWSRARLLSCPWARPRMWEQYADNHRGVCLLFDKQLLIEGLSERFVCRAVVYSPEGYAGSDGAQGIRDLGIIDPDRPETAVAAVHEHVMSHFDDFFFSKTDDWAAENEFRIIRGALPGVAVVDDDGDNAYLAIRDALRAVIVGEHFPNWQLPAAEAALAAFPEAELRRMSWHVGQPYPGKTLVVENERGR